jgi:hypothetical protein
MIERARVVVSTARARRAHEAARRRAQKFSLDTSESCSGGLRTDPGAEAHEGRRRPFEQFSEVSEPKFSLGLGRVPGNRAAGQFNDEAGRPSGDSSHLPRARRYWEDGDE